MDTKNTTITFGQANQLLKELKQKNTMSDPYGYNLKFLSLSQLKKLKKEDLVNRCIALDEVIDTSGKDIMKLEKENDKLKTECFVLKKKYSIYEEMWNELNEENYKLKKEIKKLTE
jgi:hypothetical protein